MTAHSRGAYFERLGAWLERRWADLDRDEEAFADLAADALAALPPAEHLDLEALVDHILDPDRTVGRQLAPLGAFGQPGFTAYYGRGFVVDVYFWTSALSAIHDHPFCGAFTILRGHSVHARYRFEAREELGPRIRLGRLEPDGLEHIEQGHVQRFSHRRHALIHALLHVPVPSASMVVRTVRTLGYMRYFPPTLAVAMDEPDDAIGRPLALLDALRAGGDPRYPERLEGFLSRADLETSFRALSRLWAAAPEAERLHWLQRVRARHGARADALAPALDRALVAHRADELRALASSEEDRLIATALVAASRRTDLLELLAERFADPIERLHRFVDEAGVFAADEAAYAVLAHAAIDGADLAGATRRLIDLFGAEAIAGREADVRRTHLGSAFSILTPEAAAQGVEEPRAGTG